MHNLQRLIYIQHVQNIYRQVKCIHTDQNVLQYKSFWESVAKVIVALWLSSSFKIRSVVREISKLWKVNESGHTDVRERRRVIPIILLLRWDNWDWRADFSEGLKKVDVLMRFKKKWLKYCLLWGNARKYKRAPKQPNEIKITKRNTKHCWEVI